MGGRAGIVSACCAAMFPSPHSPGPSPGHRPSMLPSFRAKLDHDDLRATPESAQRGAGSVGMGITPRSPVRTIRDRTVHHARPRHLPRCGDIGIPWARTTAGSSSAAPRTGSRPWEPGKLLRARSSPRFSIGLRTMVPQACGPFRLDPGRWALHGRNTDRKSSVWILGRYLGDSWP